MNLESSATSADAVPPSTSPAHLLEAVDKLKFFLATAPSTFPSSLPNTSPEDRALNRFLLPTGELISCVMWNGLYHVTGTDIVRALNFRFLAFGRPVRNAKKFEEGVFSDLRNLKSGTDATLEEPKSEFLELLFKHNCIRTQKKQKVFYWFSVPHDRLFLDALDRDLKREKLGQESTTEAIREPALSFRWNPSKTLFEQFSAPAPSLDLLSPTVPDIVEIAENHTLEFGSPEIDVPASDSLQRPPYRHAGCGEIAASPGGELVVDGTASPSNRDAHSSGTSSESHDVGPASISRSALRAGPAPSAADLDPSSNIFGAVALFEGSPTYKQRRRPAGRKKSGSVAPAPGSVGGDHRMLDCRVDDDAARWDDRLSPSQDYFDSSTRQSSNYGSGSASPSSAYPSCRSHQSYAGPFESPAPRSSSSHTAPHLAFPVTNNLDVYPPPPLDSRPPAPYRHSLSLSHPAVRAPRLSHLSQTRVATTPTDAHQTAHCFSSTAIPLPVLPPSVNGPSLPGYGVGDVTSSAKTYVCPLFSCGRLFKRLEHLKRHVRTHTSEKPFSCPTCSKAFARSDNLAAHIKIHDKPEPTSSMLYTQEQVDLVAHRGLVDDDDDGDDDEDNDDDPGGEEEDLSVITDGMEEPRYRSRSIADDGPDESVKWAPSIVTHAAETSLAGPMSRSYSSSHTLGYPWAGALQPYHRSPPADQLESQVAFNTQAGASSFSYHPASASNTSGGVVPYRRYRSATPTFGQGSNSRRGLAHPDAVAPRHSMAPAYGYSSFESSRSVGPDPYPPASFQAHIQSLSALSTEPDRVGGPGPYHPAPWPSVREETQIGASVQGGSVYYQPHDAYSTGSVEGIFGSSNAGEQHGLHRRHFDE